MAGCYDYKFEILRFKVSMKTGIIGLPHVGKTSLFKILTKAKVDDRGYTKPGEAHLGIATVPDERLDKLAALFDPKKLVHATIEYSDVAAIGQEAIARLREYAWPGNVRELQNVIERAVITARDGKLNLDRALPITVTSGSGHPIPDLQGVMTSRDLARLERHFYTSSSCGVCGKTALEAVRTARAIGCSGIVVVRADSAFYSAAFTSAVRAAGAFFSVTVPMNPHVAAAIAGPAPDAVGNW